MIEVPTPDGNCDAFFVHPSEGSHPGVVLWPDALGLRPAKQAMARRLAGAGYAVLAVNPYYRQVRGPFDFDFSIFRTPEGREKIMPLMAALTPEATMRDGEAFVAFLDSQDEVDSARGIGVQGYCFSGSIAIRSAARSPGRVKVAASFHGGNLVTEDPQSPHRMLGQSQADFLILFGRDDDARGPGNVAALREAAGSAGRPAEIEVYAADHGWCVPDSPSYDRAEADRAWSRLLAHYARL